MSQETKNGVGTIQVERCRPVLDFLNQTSPSLATQILGCPGVVKIVLCAG